MVVRIIRFLVPLAIGLSVLSCGGGVGSGGTGAPIADGGPSDPGAVTTVSVGPIAGFGSVIVNGIKYDDSGASISSAQRSGLTREDLRLGMTATIRGTANPSVGLGKASAIEVQSELKGFVGLRTASDFYVLGVRVRTNVNTVFDNAGNVLDGDFVEVYGTFDAVNQTLVASRIERKNASEQTLRGLVSGLNSTNRQFNLGNVVIDYSNAGVVGSLVNGSDVQVAGATPPASGAWLVRAVTLRSPIDLSNVTRTELNAVITQFTSLANFRVNDITVDGSSAVIEDGPVGSLGVGVRVEIKGTVVGGIVRATRVKFEDSSEAASGGSGGSGGSSGTGGSGTSNTASTSSTATEFDVTGRISAFVSPANFVVRGTVIDASASLRFDDGSVNNLANGACVRIEGPLQAGAFGSVLRATRVRFVNNCPS